MSLRERRTVRCARFAERGAPNDDFGFTLIELLVVLVIVAVVSVAVTLAVGGNQGRVLQNETERLTVLLQVACERALITGTDVGLRFADNSLRFGYLRGDQWFPFGDQTADELRPRSFPEGMHVVAFTEGAPVDLELEPERPHWACFASGEAIPLRVELDHAGVAERWQIEVAADAQVATKRADANAG